MQRLALLAAVTMELSSLGSSFADEELVSKKRVDALVKQLVSPNPAPKPGDGIAIFPATYDTESQKQVLASGIELQSLGRPALPFLCDHLANPRYCLTDSSGEGERNYSVGQVCFIIMIDHLQPYGRAFTKGEGDPRGRALRPSYADQFNLRFPKTAKAWWKAREEKSLRELQIETLEWVIDEEAKSPMKYSDKERDHLAAVLKDLKAADKPLEARWRFKSTR